MASKTSLARQKSEATSRNAPKNVPATRPLSRAAAPRCLPPDIAQFIGDRPLVRGEDPAEYDAVFDKVAETVAPVDAIEWIWAKDVVDALWERRRAHVMRNHIVEMNRFRALVSIVKRLDHEAPRDIWGRPGAASEALVTSWREGGAKGHAEMIRFLAQHGLDERAVATETFLAMGAAFERLDRMIESADKRRDVVIREIERRRASRAPSFQQAADVIDRQAAEDVASEDVGAGSAHR